MRGLGVWVKGLVLITDGDETGNEVILTDFFFYFFNKSEIAVVDHHVILVFDEEMIESNDDIDYLIPSWLVNALSWGFQIRHLPETHLTFLVVAENASGINVSSLFLEEIYHKNREEGLVLVLQLHEDLLLRVLDFLAFGDQWRLHEIPISEDKREGPLQKEVHYFLELRVSGEQFSDVGGYIGALCGYKEVEFFVLADLDLHRRSMGYNFFALLQLVDCLKRAVLLVDKSEEIVIGAEHYIFPERQEQGLDGSDGVFAVYF